MKNSIISESLENTKNKPDFQKTISLGNKIELKLYLKNGKHYLYNKKGEEVFLKGVNKVRSDSNINLETIDNKVVISVEYEGKESEYYLENGEQYFPIKKASKIIKGIKDVLLGISPYFR